MKDSPTCRVPHYYRLLLVVLLGLMAPRCGSDVNVTFNLRNPCSTDGLPGEGCQLIRVVVSEAAADSESA